jgi:hypothetical protein
MKDEIANLTFDELCNKIREQYGTSLPESSYDSVENLIEALKDIMIKEDKPIHSYASGYSYHGNVLKALFLDAAFHYPNMQFTLREVCEYAGLPLFKVQVMVSKWNHRKYRYMTKLKKRTSNHENVYKMRKCSYMYYLVYKKHMRRKFDLNLKRRYPKRVEIYAHINGCGRRMGLTDEALPKISMIQND